MRWFEDNAYLAWLGLALALGAIEAATVDFVFLMLAGGAVGGAVAAAIGLNIWFQVVTAVVVAALLIGFVRPVVQRRFMVPDSHTLMGAPAQIGRSAVVLSTVTAHDGRVKLGGETWSARTAPEGPVCLPGEEVRVVAIEGATAIVTSAGRAREEVQDQ
ncbi:MAG TPA: NfeD family protein [Dermatophilaceae bacterium]|nr:NfeD family protein [Dermatophilaceae bacterium]